MGNSFKVDDFDDDFDLDDRDLDTSNSDYLDQVDDVSASKSTHNDSATSNSRESNVTLNTKNQEQPVQSPTETHHKSQSDKGMTDSNDVSQSSSNDSDVSSFLSNTAKKEQQATERLEKRISIYPQLSKSAARKAAPVLERIGRRIDCGYDPNPLPLNESLEQLGLMKYNAGREKLDIALAAMNLTPFEVLTQYLSFYAMISKESIAIKLYCAAGFPVGLAREHYDKSLCSVNSKLINEVLSCRWLEQGFSLAIHGGPGLGKTLLAIECGKTAVSKGYSTYFYNASDFFLKLKKHQEKYGDVIKGPLFNCRLLIIDDIGHDVLPDANISNLFYRLVDHRDAHSLSMIFTSNLQPVDWIKSIGGIGQTQKAALDRVLHSTIVVHHEGKSSLRIRKFRKINPDLHLKDLQGMVDDSSGEDEES